MFGNYSGNKFSGRCGDDQFRKLESYSSKPSSSRDGRSAVVSQLDSSGTLKTKISLGKNPSIVHSGPFYAMTEPPEKKELTGETNLIVYHNLEHSYKKYTGNRCKEQLSSFLPDLPEAINRMDNLENSSLRSVIQKPPIGNKELVPLSNLQLVGFRLHPEPLPQQYRTHDYVRNVKHKNHKHKNHTISPETTSVNHTTALHVNEKKNKKHKRHEDDKERKKRKKDKKEKKRTSE